MVYKLILLLLGIGLHFQGILAWQEAAFEKNRAHILLDQGIEVSEVEAVCMQEQEEENPIGFCFWGEGGQRQIRCSLTGATTEVTVIFLAGDGQLLEAGALQFQTGCVVDEETAVTLFGTASCGGQPIQMGMRTYPVLGTITAARPTMILKGTAENGAAMNRCVLSVPLEQSVSAGEQFLIRHQIQGTVLDYRSLWAITENLLLVFPGILVLAALGYLAGDWRNLSVSGILSGGQWKPLGKTGLALVLAVVSLWGLGRLIYIPGNMIPSRWSDFSFWSSWWDDQKEALLRILQTPPGNGQLQMQINMVKSMGNSTAAALLALWKGRREVHANPADRG